MTVKKSFSHRSFLLSVQLCCALTPMLMAQSVVAEESAETFDEVIVTASKRNQALKDFSGSVSIVKGDSFNPGATISDLADQVPGLSVISNGPRGITSVNIRGLRMDEVSSNDFGGDGATVATYIDNIPLQGFFVPPANTMKDLQQIEVLRGPQGTLYGNSSIGGLIRYVTAKPDLTKNTFTINTAISQTAESDDLNYDTDFVGNVSFIENVLAARVMLSKESNAGFIDNDSLLTGKKDDINSDETKQIRTSILWKPTDEFSLNGSYSYQKINADDRQAVNRTLTDDKYTSFNFYLQPMEGKLKLSSLDAGYDFGWATLTASVSRYDYTTKTTADQTDFLLYNYGAGYYAEYDDFSAFRNGNVDVLKDRAEVRLVSPNDQPLRWLIGAFFSKDDLDVIISDFAPGFGDFSGEYRPHDLDSIFTQAEILHEQSFYGEVAYDFTSQWEASIGVRHFRYKDELNSCELVFPASVDYEGDNYPLSCLDNDDDQSGSLGKFSTKYKFSDDQNIYFTIAEGFRRGGANLLPLSVTHDHTYEPDTVVNYELGTHSDFLNGKLQFNGAIFYTNWKNIQVSSVIAYRSATVNADTARTKGIELETIAELSEQWSTRLSYSYTDAVITKTVVGVSGGAEDANSGDRLPGSPKQEWNLGVNYKKLIKTATFTASVNYAYASDMTTALNKGFVDYAELDGYSTVNANAGVSLRNWNLGVFANNLTNTYAITDRRTATLYGDHGQFDYITRPRTIGLKASYQF